MRTLGLGLAALLAAASTGCDAAPSPQPALVNRAATSAAAGTDLPRLTGRVVDDAGLIGPTTEADLVARSAALERRTRDQLVIVTTPDLHGRSIEAFGRAVGIGWGIGQKDLDNGVLLIVAPNERKVRIEVGTGLEALLTNARAQQIVDRTLLPGFQRGEYEAAIAAGVREIAATLESDLARPKRLAGKAKG